MSLPDSPESRLRAVENKIERLEESVREMKAYRNTLIPISRLPTEILSIIFSLLPSFETQAQILPTNYNLYCLSCLPPMARDFTQPTSPLESHQLHHAVSGWRC